MIVPPLDLGPGFLLATLAICVLSLAGIIMLVALDRRRRNLAASSMLGLGVVSAMIIVLVLEGL